MDRNELIEVGASALYGEGEEGPSAEAEERREGCRSLAEDVIDAVEPVIRADERVKVGTEANAVVRAKDERIADLLEDRDALRSRLQSMLLYKLPPAGRDSYNEAIKDVLALIKDD